MKALFAFSILSVLIIGSCNPGIAKDLSLTGILVFTSCYNSTGSVIGFNHKTYYNAIYELTTWWKGWMKSGY